MHKKGDSSENTPQPPNSSTVILLLSTIGDTTWRMFLPTIGMMLFGAWLDERLDTNPWLVVCGCIVGSIMAGFLIREQLRKKY